MYRKLVSTSYRNTRCGTQCYSKCYTAYGLSDNKSCLQVSPLTKPSQRGVAHTSLPSQAQVVVCGAGVLACSIAYHLTREGWRDVLVLEKNKISSGTSHEGSGMLGVFKDAAERKMISQSLDLVKQLQLDGHDLDFNQCGSLNLAGTRERAEFLKRRLAAMKPSGVEVEWLDRTELSERHPQLETSDLEGGVWCGADGVVDPQRLCVALAAGARQQGAMFLEGVDVLRVRAELRDSYSSVTPRVSRVDTTRGSVRCEYFVNAAGMWAREVGEKSEPRVRVPAFPAEHFFLHTFPMPESEGMPIVRDYDARTFVVPRGGRYIIGGFEERAKPAFGRSIPDNWREQLTGDDQHFRPTKAAAQYRLPSLKDAHFQPLINAPDTFTPDGLWIMGETPEVDNYFVCCGMNGNSAQPSGGIGRAMAEQITQGMGTVAAAETVAAFDVKRFTDIHNNRRYLEERVKEAVGRHYAIVFPAGQSEFSLARKLRTSPIYTMQEEAGAVFGERMGFERPHYFNTEHVPGEVNKPPPPTFRKPAFHDMLAGEYEACRYRVGLIDLSSFTKIDITSGRSEVVTFLQKLCSNDVDVPLGGVVNTGMHNEHGGYENDCLLIRRSNNRYLMLAPTIQRTKVMDWLNRNVTPGTNVSCADITSMFSVLSTVGPKSRDLLSRLSSDNLNFFGHTAMEVNVGYASDVLMLSFTHMGEPGYTLIIPSEYTIHVYDQIMKVGKDYGIRNVGMLTMRSLRVEKFIPFWAEELGPTVTPFEVGRGYRVKMNKDYFLGKFALARQQTQGVRRRLTHFTLAEGFEPEADLWPWGGEPIYRGGQWVGSVTSAAYGFTLRRMVCLGFVHHPSGDLVSEDYVTSGSYEIDIGGRRFPLIPSLNPPKIPISRMAGLNTYKPRVRGIIR